MLSAGRGDGYYPFPVHSHDFPQRPGPESADLATHPSAHSRPFLSLTSVSSISLEKAACLGFTWPSSGGLCWVMKQPPSLCFHIISDPNWSRIPQRASHVSCEEIDPTSFSMSREKRTQHCAGQSLVNRASHTVDPSENHLAPWCLAFLINQ